jgi:hypothetical protein
MNLPGQTGEAGLGRQPVRFLRQRQRLLRFQELATGPNDWPRSDPSSGCRTGPGLAAA